MKIDPEKIARMITEDPDVAPSDHFDDFEDEYESNDDDFDGECDWCGVGIHAGGDHMDNYDGDFDRIYAEVDRLSKTEEALEYLKEHAVNGEVLLSHELSWDLIPDPSLDPWG